MTTITPTITDPRPAMSRPSSVIGFLLLTLALSWGAWLLGLLLGGDLADPLVFGCFAVGTCGPTLAALLYRLRGVRSPRTADVRRIARWLPAAVLLGALPVVLAALVGPLLGDRALGLDDVTAGFAATGLLPFLLFATVTGPLSEEFGWRGFVQPRLRERFSPIVTAGILGSIWGIWHLPLALFPGTFQSALGPLELVGFVVSMVPMSLTYWFVTERLAGGVPAAVLMHYATNVALTLLPFTGLAGSLVLLTAITLIAVVLALVVRGTARPGRDR
ncbi:CPBP family intramembrane glutamic endopeptidase [Propionibacteriaceae bacterium Y2011]